MSNDNYKNKSITSNSLSINKKVGINKPPPPTPPIVVIIDIKTSNKEFFE